MLGVVWILLCLIVGFCGSATGAHYYRLTGSYLSYLPFVLGLICIGYIGYKVEFF